MPWNEKHLDRNREKGQRKKVPQTMKTAHKLLAFNKK